MNHRSAPLLDPPLPLLVTGIAGVAGYNAFHYFHSKYPGQVIGIRQENNWPLSGTGIEACDAENQDVLAKLFDHYQFAAVLNCAGNCKLKSCELDPPLAWRINLGGVQNLLNVIGSSCVRLVHLSVDLVFSGTGTGWHVEDDEPDPVTVYGKTMVAAENLLLAENPAACILRISLPMGVSFNGHAGAIDWIQSRFMKNKPATLYYDEIRTPTYTDCLNRVCQAVLAGDYRGLFHAGGPQRLSLYEIAQIVNRIGGYDPDHLQGCYRIEAGPVPPRAGNVSLDSSKLAKELNFTPFDPWPFNKTIIPDHPQWHYERSSEERGTPELLADVLYRNPAIRRNLPQI